MKNQNFYLRLIALLLILMAVFFYNGTVKDREQKEDIAELNAKVESMQTQQEEILTALEEAYEEHKAAASQADTKEDVEETDSVTSEENEEGSENYYKNGTFEGSGTGFGGTITVQVTLKDDTISDISVVSAAGEDSAYLSQAQNIISTVLDEQSTDVDTISGATFSSTGILEAVNDALAKAENQ